MCYNLYLHGAVQFVLDPHRTDVWFKNMIHLVLTWCCVFRSRSTCYWCIILTCVTLGIKQHGIRTFSEESSSSYAGFTTVEILSTIYRISSYHTWIGYTESSYRSWKEIIQCEFNDMKTFTKTILKWLHSNNRLFFFKLQQ